MNYGRVTVSDFERKRFPHFLNRYEGVTSLLALSQSDPLAATPSVSVTGSLYNSVQSIWAAFQAAERLN
jgi:hypothetical protein